MSSICPGFEIKILSFFGLAKSIRVAKVNSARAERQPA
jgi:hypothetical protein